MREKEKEILLRVKSGEISCEEAKEIYRRLVNNARKNGKEKEDKSGREEIAIIGISCRYASADNPREFWENLRSGRNLVTEVPDERWDVNTFFDPSKKRKDKTYCKWGSFLSDISCFDAAFFNISGMEARYMDPQQRFFLQECWRALEDSGYTSKKIAGQKCGVFAGMEESDYSELIGDQAEAQAFWGNAGSILSSRISYFLNLKGPAVTINTACSSSLVAVNMGCQSLMLHESDLILAGGVYIQNSPKLYISSSRAGMLSSTGQCYTFDSRADGFVPGEGVGVVVLKRLSQALKDNDFIYGIIKGSGVNQDGTTNGITAPSMVSQRDLELDVYAKYNLNPEDFQYVEAHGTGTELGDPIEVRALTESFRKYTDKKNFCAIGSVKTNIGHTTYAAGVAGLIKILMAMQHREIPPSLNFEKSNPHIDFDGSPFFVNTELKKWNVPAGKPRRAAISAFGFSGTNAHLVIEEAGIKRITGVSRPYYLFCLSAKDENVLEQKVKDLYDFMKQDSPPSLSDVSFTLLCGRDHFNHRLAIVASDVEELTKGLERSLREDAGDNFVKNRLRVKDKRDESRWEEGRKAVELLNNTDPADISGYKRKLFSLAELYVQGYNVLWEKMFTGEKSRIIPLPTYPFAEDRFWITEKKESLSGKKGNRNRDLAGEISLDDAADEDVKKDLLFAGERWVTKVVEYRESAAHETKIIFLSTKDEALVKRLSVREPGAEVLQVSPAVDISVDQIEKFFFNVFDKIKSLIKSGVRNNCRILFLAPGNKYSFIYSFFAGLFKTTHIENPKILGKVVFCPDMLWDNDDDLLEIIKKENSPGAFPEVLVRYSANGKTREVKILSELELTGNTQKSIIKEGGVYWITGGTGGLGNLFAGYLAGTENTKLILSGRSPLDSEKQTQIDRIARPGVEIVYKQVDVSRKDEVEDVFRQIIKEYGTLNGILHSAGTVRDSYIINKTHEEISEVFGPKIEGVINIDQTTKDMDLDFIVFFSSMSSLLGNAGQSDYASANAFLDGYASFRQGLVENGDRAGQTLSINWPLWENGGMRMDIQSEKVMREKNGMIPMDNKTGFNAFSAMLYSGLNQAMVIMGDLRKLNRYLFEQKMEKVEGMKKQNITNKKDVNSRIIHKFVELFSSVVQIPESKIDEDETFDAFGIDSIMIARMNQLLEEIFGPLSKTLLFEYQTLSGLCSYFIQEHFDKCLEWAGVKKGPGAEIIPGQDLPEAVESRKKSREFFISKTGDDIPIAIVGVDGRYPASKNLDEFWKNLKEGVDCISEIPRDRWDYREYFEPDRQRAAVAGKSYGKWGGFLEGFADFDPLFFNISPIEAANMDPQERLFLQSCWAVLEDAGYSPGELNALSGRPVGVFAGVTKNTFHLYGPDILAQGDYGLPNSFYWTIANRVSYILNLRGPSMPVDTACSSSLTAIHEACEYIRRGECGMAIVGGVNLYLHPLSYVVLSANQMLSSDGKCRSFGHGGDGFVPGEGVGTILLKRLDLAEEDGDHIYGIVRGTAINHGGKTNGYTVPNPVAQGELVARTIKKAGLTAEMMSYIETHGTGTALGDPIEVTGLTQAFRKDTDKNGFCSIGSVKANIGHLEAAAGIAGLTKILLQFKHKKLAPSLHSGTLNKNINFSNTPFVVQQKLEDWIPPVDEKTGRPYPRLAGLSSFGAGGANAHVILEEYVPGKSRMVPGSRPSLQEQFIIPLSARNEERLQVYAKHLAQFFREEKSSGINLDDVAYTLQVGREGMRSRLVLVVETKDELILKLEDYGNNKKVSRGCYTGDSVEGRSSIKKIIQDEDFDLVINKWIAKGKTVKLAELWAEGYDFDWKKLYENDHPRRLSLPTYPFLKERYWVSSTSSFLKVGDKLNRIHPFVHRVDYKSSLAIDKGFVFETFLSPGDVVLKDHKLKDTPVFPGVCYLEMVYAGAKQCHPEKNYHICDVLWISPLYVTEKVNVKLTLRAEAGRFSYEVSSHKGGTVTLHSTGMLQETGDDGKKQFLDIDLIKKRLSVKWKGKEGQEIFYKASYDKGIQYGPCFQPVSALWSNEEEVLGVLEVSHSNDLTCCYLHPGILDGALQCTVGFDRHGTTQAELPFTMGQLTYKKKFSEKMYSYIKRVTEQRYDIYLLDHNGEICATINGFQVRGMKKALDKMLFAPRWDRCYIPLSPVPPAGNGRGKVLVVYHENCYSMEEAIINAEGADRCLRLSLSNKPVEIENFLSDKPDISRIYFLGGLWSQEGDLFDLSYQITRRDYGVLSFFRLIKTLIRNGYDRKELEIIVLTGDCHNVSGDCDVDPGGAGLTGFTRSLAKEYVNWKVKAVDFSRHALCYDEKQKLMAVVQSEPWNPEGDGSAYRDGFRYVSRISALTLEESGRAGFKKDGVYVILGGSGGIGFALTELIVEKYKASIIWIGRSALNERIKDKITAVAARGQAPVYIQADASRPGDMEKALKEIMTKWGKVNGVIHSAIVLNDKSLDDMTEECFLSALAPKVEGSILLCKAFEAANPDWFCFFSSGQSFIGARGQSNYAAGCTYKDAFAHSLKKKTGRPVHIINWGYWGSVGIVAEDKYRDRMNRQGFYSIEPGEGFEVMERMFAAHLGQIYPLKVSGGMAEKMGYETDHQIKVFKGNGKSSFETISSIVSGGDKKPEDSLLAISVNKEFEDFMVDGLIEALSSLGFFEALAFEPELPGLMARLTILPKYRRLFEELLCILLREKILVITGKGLILNGPARVERCNGTIRSRAEELTGKYPGLRAKISLVSQCLSGFGDVLLGKVSATDIVFPGSSMKLVEGVYKGNETADYFNRRMADVVEAFIMSKIDEIQKPQKIRIIEIGAGTGGTSAFVFKKLNKYSECIEYVYTDISKSFLSFAEEIYYPQNPYISLEIFNVEKSIEEQEFSGNSFDLVIATNVLHATKNMTHTMNHVKQLLKPHGLLLINEIANVQNFATLTFGLLDGWWRYSDEELRLPGSPGLSPGNWKHLLCFQGFNKVCFPAQKAHEMGQQIILAESNGVVYQKANLPVLEEKSFNFREIKQIPAVSVKHKNETLMGNKIDDYTGEACIFIKDLLAGTLRIAAERIDENAPLEDYGIDSILTVQLTNQLEKTFGKLPRTLFFEYQTIKEVTGYFMENYKDKLMALLGFNEQEYSLEEPEAGDDGSVEEKRSGYKNFVIPETVRNVDKEVAVSDNTFADIAVIGVSGHYAQAENIKAFWEILKTGRDCITEVPEDRWDYREYCTPEKETKGNRWGGFITNAEKFDPLFFNISPREAVSIDPQERLFLQTAWETLEDAGYTRASIKKKYNGNVGVYAGVMYSEYSFYGIEQSLYGKSIAISNTPASVANRISYICNFTGPSMSLDTQCSSSLTAVHLACEALRNGSIDLALAGGVNLSLHPNKYIALTQGKFLSSKGRCEAFGAGGDGFIPGEGVGCILLKPFASAKKDGDHIYGIIKGSALNHGGKTNGYTVPNPNGQAEVISRALENAGIKPHSISYIEAHGTGTSLGDPIEIAGLAKAFKKEAWEQGSCAIGSVKSNIGHCESAAGIAGITKVLLQMKNQKLVPSLHTAQLNPDINFDEGPFYVQQTLSDWNPPEVWEVGQKKTYPRRAGISSFGAGGANAHVILEEYQLEPSTAKSVSSGIPVLFVLSARKKNELVKQAERMLALLREEKTTGFSLADMAYTLQVGREAMEERLAIVVSSLSELEQKLAAFVKGESKIEGLLQESVKRDRGALALFSADKDLLDELDAMTATGDYKKLAELWVQGLIYDWERLYINENSRRISLPTYPFAGDRYWIKTDKRTFLSKPGFTTSEKEISSFSANADFSVKRKKEGRAKIILSLPTDIGNRKKEIKKAPKQPIELMPFTREKSPAPERNHTEPENMVLEKFSSNASALSEEELRKSLKNSLAEALYISRDEIDMDTQFIDIGLDSIIGIEWIRGINKQYGISEGATVVYDHPNIRDLAGYLTGKINRMVQRTEKKLFSKDNFTSSVKETATNIDAGEVKQRAGINRKSHSGESLEKELTVSLAEALYLKLDDIDPEKQFIDMGLDSILGLEWIRKINKKYNLSISTTAVYDYPTLKEISVFLNDKIDAAERNNITLPLGNDKTDREFLNLENLQEELKRSLGDALYIDGANLDMDKQFIDMGLDSIVGVEWIGTINRKYSLSLEATKLYEYPTLIEFSEYLRKRILEEKGNGPVLDFKTILNRVYEGTLNYKEADQYFKTYYVEQIVSGYR